MPKKILAAMLVLLLTGCSGPSPRNSGIGTELSTAPITEDADGVAKPEDRSLFGSRNDDDDEDGARTTTTTVTSARDSAGGDNGAGGKSDRSGSKTSRTSRISEPEAQVKPKTQGRPKGFEFESGVLEFGKFDPATFKGELFDPCTAITRAEYRAAGIPGVEPLPQDWKPFTEGTNICLVSRMQGTASTDSRVGRTDVTSEETSSEASPTDNAESASVGKLSDVRAMGGTIVEDIGTRMMNRQTTASFERVDESYSSEVLPSLYVTTRTDANGPSYCTAHLETVRGEFFTGAGNVNGSRTHDELCAVAISNMERLYLAHRLS